VTVRVSFAGSGMRAIEAEEHWQLDGTRTLAALPRWLLAGAQWRGVQSI
jgi:hypothetical protein